MSTFLNKPLSLIERKKLQWAKEKEELSRLTTSSWGKTFAPKRISDLFQNHQDTNRRQSLPPINQENDRDFGGETSGYGSDTPKERKWKEEPPNPWGSQLDVKTFWESSEEVSKIKDAPGWLKRGLQRNVELLVANSSPSESPEQDYKNYYDDRPNTSGSSISQTKSFIRGQNIHLDPAEVAVREQKRQIALAHQEAIKLQLEEREKRKREERERKLSEEKKEESRLEREREIERERVEKEQNALKEKQEKEQMRKEAMKRALEQAQREAEERKKQKNRPKTPLVEENSTIEIEEKIEKSPPVSNDTKKENEEEDDDNNNKQIEEIKEDFNYIQNAPIILPPSTECFNTNSMQFAIIVPTMNSGNPITTVLPISLPMASYKEEKSPKRTTNRVLTPSSYRHKKYRNSSTQTENSYLFDNRKNKFGSAQKKSRRGSRTGTSDSLNNNNLSDRPKWGANRTHVRYVKQSEKDPFYQRKKYRMKKIQPKNNNYSPRSSDDSETATNTEPMIRKKTRALWRKKTEIVPLETHNNQLYYKLPNCDKCYCRCHNSKINNSSPDVLKIDHESKDNNNLITNYNHVLINNEIIDKLNTDFQKQLFLKEETDSLCSPSISLSQEYSCSKDSSL